MAISLKNIDDRLKVVESKIISSTARVVKLYSGHKTNNTTNITLSESCANFDLISFQCWDWNSSYSWFQTVNVKSVPIGTSVVIRQSKDPSFWMNCLFKSTTNFQLSGQNVGFGDIYGLKLYYNFSYNIIYKILSSIKFKISQIISSPKIKRR